MAAPHRIVIIDNDTDVRDLLEVLIDLDDRFDLVGAAADGHAGVAIVRDLDPDAVILDLEMPGLTGLDTLGMIGMISPRARIVVFSAFPDPITLIDVLRLGADGYLDKATAWKELLPTVAGLCSFEALAS